MTPDLSRLSACELRALGRAYRLIAVQRAEAIPTLQGPARRAAWVAMLHATDMAAECEAEASKRDE
jgi:hypothetical protein